jgi:hypothetical protein
MSDIFGKIRNVLQWFATAGPWREPDRRDAEREVFARFASGLRGWLVERADAGDEGGCRGPCWLPSSWISLHPRVEVGRSGQGCTWSSPGAAGEVGLRCHGDWCSSTASPRLRVWAHGRGG